MKKILKGFALAAAAFLFAGEANAATLVNKFGVDTEICDPVLIYTGGLSKRAYWAEPNLRPFLTHLYADGTRQWFYDTFIFNETNWYDSQTGETRVLVNSGGGQLPATLADWTAFLDYIFAPAHDLHALDKAIDKWKPTLGEPILKHKVIIGLCYPCKDGRGTPGACEWKKFNFGIINGVDMDFSSIEHRLTASKWYVDEVIRRFEEANFKNLELVGMYCPEETLFSVYEFCTQVNDYIHSKGLRTYWIPYWANNDQYALEHKDTYHFDMTWRQPNYFFYNRDGSLPPKSQLRDCIKSCKYYGLGVELEVETSGTSNGLHQNSEKMHQRFIDYIDYFEEYDVWGSAGVAHYFGSKGLVDFAASMDPVDQATIDRLCDIVRRRQQAFAQNSGIEAPAVEQTVFAYPGQGCIFISNAPQARVYNLGGALIHSGNGTVNCPAGLYVATDGRGNTVKIAVK